MKFMKKLTALVATLAMTISMLPSAVMAETNPGINLWSATNSHYLGLEQDDVGNGNKKPVLKWEWGVPGADQGSLGGNQSYLTYHLGKLDAGTYQLEVRLRCAGNPGRFVISTYPTNWDEWTTIPCTFNDNYTVYTQEKTVAQSDDYNYLRFWRVDGANGTMRVDYISLRKKNDDGTLGDNLIFNGDFMATENATLDHWSDTDKMSFVSKEIDGKVLPVMNLRTYDGTNSGASCQYNKYIYYHIGQLREAGTYRVSGKYYVPQNVGMLAMGLAFEGLEPDRNRLSGKQYMRSVDFETYTYDVSVSEEEASLESKLCVEVNGGLATPLYLADFSVRKVNADGTLGPNLMVNENFASPRKAHKTVSGWDTWTGTDPSANFTVREVQGADGNMTKALVSYKDAGNAEEKWFRTRVATKAGKTYRLSLDQRRGATVNESYVIVGDTNQGFRAPVSLGMGMCSWSTFTHDFVMGNSDVPENELCFMTRTPLNGYLPQMHWYDNVTFCEVLEDGTLGPNLVQNGDFEAKDVSVSGLKFDILDADGNSFTDGVGYAEFTAVPEDYQMVATVSVSNDEKEPISPLLYAAVYKGGALYSLKQFETSILAGETKTCTWALDMPTEEEVAEDDFTAKAFAWIDDTLVPLTAAVEIIEAVE